MEATTVAHNYNTLSNALTYIVGIGAICGLALSGWQYALTSKIKSISTLWTKFDVHTKEYNKNRVDDAKEFASRNEMQSLGSRLERKIDSSESKLECRIESLGEKIDLALAELRRRDA